MTPMNGRTTPARLEIFSARVTRSAYVPGAAKTLRSGQGVALLLLPE
jgi:hypothetical protein